MTTEKQKTANRRNALRSTGPATPAGKAKVARNAVRHGLRSRDVLLANEDGEVFAHMQREVCFELRPEGEVETFLARRIAAGIWRLNRLLRVEAALFDEPEFSYSGRENGLANIFRGQVRQGANSFDTLMRYEAALERGVFKALHEMERRRRTREGENVPPPLAVDFSLSADGQ